MVSPIPKCKIYSAKSWGGEASLWKGNGGHDAKCVLHLCGSKRKNDKDPPLVEDSADEDSEKKQTTTPKQP